MNSTQRGYLYGASESFTNALSSSASAGAAAAPSAQTTYAHGLTRPSPSARATTAHSRTAAAPALADELKAFVKDSLAPYKYPRWVEFIPELPKTSTGKIQRFKLRQTAS